MKEKIKEIQTILKVAVDGIVGKNTLRALCNALGASFNSNLVECTKNVQKAVGTTADGIIGPITANAILEKIKNYKASPKDYKIFLTLDIGHANGTGARGNGLEEHAVNTVIVPLVQQILEKTGKFRTTILDYAENTNEKDLVLTKSAINRLNPDLNVSFHCDWADSPSAKGGHVIYNKENSKLYAKFVADEITALFPGRAEKVYHRTNLAVLNVTPPSILVESGFISSPSDSSVMKNHPEKIAQAIANGIIKAFS